MANAQNGGELALACFEPGEIGECCAGQRVGGWLWDFVAARRWWRRWWRGTRIDGAINSEEYVRGKQGAIDGYELEAISGVCEQGDRAFGVILLDMNYTRYTTSGEEGLDLIAALREQRVPAALIAMTAWGDVSLAVPVEDREMAAARRVRQSLLPQNKGG